MENKTKIRIQLKTKKYLCIVMTLALILCLVACGGSKSNWKDDHFKNVAFSIDSNWERNETNAIEGSYDSLSYDAKSNDKIDYSIYVGADNSMYSDINALKTEWEKMIDEPVEYDTPKGVKTYTENVDKWENGEFAGYIENCYTEYPEGTLTEAGIDSEKYNIETDKIKFKYLAFDVDDTIYFLGVTVYVSDTEKAYSDFGQITDSLKLYEGESDDMSKIESEEISVGNTVKGEIKKDAESNKVYTCQAEAGKTYEINLKSKTEDITPIMNILDSEGNNAAYATSVDVFSEGYAGNIRYNINSDETSKYFISVGSLANDEENAKDMSYELIIKEITDVGTIKGKITDESGKPLPGCYVSVMVSTYIEGSDSDGYSVTTDKNGNYALYGVEPGTYSLLTSLDGFESVDYSEMKISVDGTVKKDFKLKKD